jgi:hypothetical protein
MTQASAWLIATIKMSLVIFFSCDLKDSQAKDVSDDIA